MKIHPIIANNLLQNIFYILEYGEKQALVIDPPEAKLAQVFLDEHDLQLQKILITHEHYDHYDGVEGLDCGEIFASEIASKNIPFSVKNTFQDGDIVFQEDTISIRAIATPGHADGHVIFEVSESVGNEDLRSNVVAIFSGDALFQGGVGHTRRGGTEVLYESLQKFQKYDDGVIIYSGHDYLGTNLEFLKQYTPENILEIQAIEQKACDPFYFTSLGEERNYNPFLTAGKEEFIRLRELRNNF